MNQGKPTYSPKKDQFGGRKLSDRKSKMPTLEREDESIRAMDQQKSTALSKSRDRGRGTRKRLVGKKWKKWRSTKIYGINKRQKERCRAFGGVVMKSLPRRDIGVEARIKKRKK